MICKNGIDVIRVLDADGKESKLFNDLNSYFGNPDEALNAYLATETPSLMEDYNGKYSESGEPIFSDFIDYINTIPEMPMFSKTDTGNPKDQTSVPNENVTLKNILEAEKRIEAPKETADGSQENFYRVTTDRGRSKEVRRAGSFIEEFILKSDPDAPKDTSKSAVDRRAEAIVRRDFAGRGIDETITKNGKELTREDYFESVKVGITQSMVKGNITHSFLELMFEGPNGSKSNKERIMRDIRKQQALSTMPEGTYDYVTDPEVFNAIVSNLKLSVPTTYNKVPKEQQDTIRSEVRLYSDILEIGGTADLIRETSDGYIQVIETKTGSGFTDYEGSRRMRFGDQIESIRAGSVNRAKLQAALYSVMIKLNNPEAKILPPKVLHIPDEALARSPRSVHEVNMKVFLPMVETLLKREYPSEYARMKEQSPEIFNPIAYGEGDNYDLVRRYDGMTEKEVDRSLQEDRNRLFALTVSVKQRVAELGPNHDWTAKESQERQELTQRILRAESAGITIPLDLKEDMEVRWLASWVSTMSETHNPYIQAYAQLVEKARMQSNADFQAAERKNNELLTKVMHERGINTDKGISRAFRDIDSRKFYSKYLRNETKMGENNTEIVDRVMLTPKDEAWQTLTKAEQEWLSNMQESMKALFNEVMVDGDQSVIGRNRFGGDLTKLDLYNQQNSFEWFDGFIPRASITQNEVRWGFRKQLGTGKITNAIKERASEWVRRNLSYYYEEHVDNIDSNFQFGIPVRFLGSGKFTHNPEIHSENLHSVYNGFMQHFNNKKQYDTLYALGDSIKGLFDTVKDAQGNPLLKGASDFLGAAMYRNLIGHIQNRDYQFLRKGLTLGTVNGRDVTLSLIKPTRQIVGIFAKALMWLNIPSALVNAGEALYQANKEGWINEIAEQGPFGLSKMNTNEKYLQASNKKAYKEFMSFQAATMKGEGKSHPYYVFTRTFNVYPEMSELTGRRNYDPLAGGKLFKTDNLSILYSLPEEFAAATLGMNYMMTNIIQEGPYKGKSMWDVYTESIKVDDNGVGYYDLPKDFTRGKIKYGDGVVRDLKGLTPMEVQKMKRIIQRIRGGYRMEERSRIESSVFGEAFMLFKRWLPALIRTGFESKRDDAALGFFERAPGEDYYVWKTRVVEGRWRTVGGVLGTMFKLIKDRSYKWDDLSSTQKMNMYDLVFTILMGGAAAAVYNLSGISDRDEEDQIRKMSYNMSMRLIDQWNAFGMAKNMLDKPMAVARAVELSEGFVSFMIALGYLSFGNEDKARTNRGDLKGSNQILKNIPATSWYYQTKNFYDGINIE